MDAQARKALFRKKLAEKKEKRIDSPLIRYNEADQPVCRVCNVVLKSDSLWEAHQISSKHREAVNNLKAQASGLTKVNDVKAVSHPGSSKPRESKSEYNTESNNLKVQSSTKLSKTQSNSGLPADFFDKKDSMKMQSVTSVGAFDSVSSKKLEHKTQTPAMMPLYTDVDTDELPEGNGNQLQKGQPGNSSVLSSEQMSVPQSKHVTGSLPEGFFDNKEADLQARGIKVIKPDVKDEYKEFEKLIQEDLVEMDNRLEEEEIDAAEMNEEAESVEQRAYREKVEMLKKRKLELMLSRSAKHRRNSEAAGEESSSEGSSDDESNENLTVDWRAQHL